VVSLLYIDVIQIQKLLKNKVLLQNLKTSQTTLREELTKHLLLKDGEKKWRVSPNTWQD
jgi:hypothetical protein